uniref:3-hydroxyisobutyryl-CoA hydrolase, mitochondrial n=1 Tax=Panagrolaimus davidi TaxID=227884 RepID=A0A914QSI7_9BILA
MLRLNVRSPTFLSQVIKRTMSSTAESEVLFDCENAARIITLNRPKALNALNLSMVRQIYPKMKEWMIDENAGLVIIKGAGDKAFCAGGDVLSVIQSAKSGGSIHKEFFREEYILNYLIGTYKLPYIALIDGITMGGGCGLSIHGKFRVATERTLLAMPETALGLFPDVGGSYFLPRLPGKLGMFLALTGYRLKGADVFHSGLATHYIESKNISEVENELKILPKAECSEQKIDKVLRKFTPKNVPEFSLKSNLETINTTFNGKSVENIIEKLQAKGDEFSKKQVNELMKMSPTSLKVTFQQLMNGSVSNFSSIFTMEHRMTYHFLDGNDFYEGCRAILVDKDRNPKWNPNKLEDISPEDVNKYFSAVYGVEDLILYESVI